MKKQPNKNPHNLNIDLEYNNKENVSDDNNLSFINLDSDEIISDFMVGGKKINIKLNDDISQKIINLDQPIDKLEELDKNKKPSNLFHKTSKLSCTSIMSKPKNIILMNLQIMQE